MAKLKFQIVTPERTLLSEEIDSVTCPTKMGDITVLPNHIPLIASLDHGELVVRNGNSSRHMAVSGGFVEIRPKNEVVVLADVAEYAEEIDLAAAEEAKRKAEESMKNAHTLSEEEYASISAALQRSLTKIKVAHKHRTKHNIHIQEDV